MSEAGAESAELARDASWRRLDLRMLLVHPVNELIRFLPFLIGIFILGSGNDDGGPWHYLGVVIPVLIGVVRFASTRFRVTGTQIELRRGLLGRSTLTAPLDRVRTVELTASVIHRLLRLEKVEIGTGSANRDGDGRLVLDSLGAEEARVLRQALLHRAGHTGPEPAAAAAVPEDVILRFDPAWARYAPLTTSGLVIALAALGASSQFLGSLVDTALHASEVDEQVKSLPLLVTVPLGLISFLVVVSVLSTVGYLLGNWGFTVTRDRAAHSFHVRRGALTTRQTSLDVDRLRGVEVHEPLGLRLAGAGRLNAIVTGLNRRAEGSATVVPAAPRPVVIGVGEALLAEAGPLHTDLIRHGPVARRRRLVRAVVPLALVPAALALAALLGDAPAWPVVLSLPLPAIGVALGIDRYRRLGHALTPSHLVMRWGSLRGRRDALQRTGIIGWQLRQTFFQRRAGIASLTAMTAAGQQSYEVMDVEEAVAVALADAAVPGLVGQFLR